MHYNAGVVAFALCNCSLGRPNFSCSHSSGRMTFQAVCKTLKQLFQGMQSQVKCKSQLAQALLVQLLRECMRECDVFLAPCTLFCEVCTTLACLMCITNIEPGMSVEVWWHRVGSFIRHMFKAFSKHICEIWNSVLTIMPTLTTLTDTAVLYLSILQETVSLRIVST